MEGSRCAVPAAAPSLFFLFPSPLVQAPLPQPQSICSPPYLLQPKQVHVSCQPKQLEWLISTGYYLESPRRQGSEHVREGGLDWARGRGPIFTVGNTTRAGLAGSIGRRKAAECQLCHSASRRCWLALCGHDGLYPQTASQTNKPFLKLPW